MTDQSAPQQDYVVAPPVKRLVGNQWDFGLTFTQGGQPVDLTASPPVAEFFGGGPLPPLILSVGSGIVLTGPGTAIFSVPAAVTAALAGSPPRSPILPVRLAAGVLDTSGQRRIRLILPIIVVDPRSACS